MAFKEKIAITVLILSFSFCMNSFAQYEELVGKWVKINGPLERRIIGIAFDQNTCDRVSLTLSYGDREDFDNVLDSFNILRIKNHVSALVVDIDLFKGRAKVVILSGRNKGISGWIPLSWLDGNDEFPTLSKK